MGLGSKLTGDLDITDLVLGVASGEDSETELDTKNTATHTEPRVEYDVTRGCPNSMTIAPASLSTWITRPTMKRKSLLWQKSPDTTHQRHKKSASASFYMG